MSRTLAQIHADMVALQAGLADPPVGGDELQAAVAAVRHFPINADAPGPPGATVALLSPSSGVPRPTDDRGATPDPLAGPLDPFPAGPAVVEGPPGPQGDPGPPGPQGPPGPGVDPARFDTLESAVLEIQLEQLTTTVINNWTGR